MTASRVASPLDAPAPGHERAPVVAGVGAIFAHGLLVLLAVVGAGVAREVSAPLAVTEWVSVELPPPTEATKEETKPLAPPEPQARPAPQPRQAKPVGAPPTAAAASPALTADGAAGSGDSIVTGAGPGYAGGVTDGTGTSLFVVRDVRARGAVSAAPTSVSAPELDRSRAPRLAGGMRWDCPFPPEADLEGIDRAVVSLRVDLTATGEVLAARATTDPGFGFARVATRCALSKRWAAALDRRGNPVAATTVVTVRFDR